MRYEEERKTVIRKMNNSDRYVLDKLDQIKFPKQSAGSLRAFGYVDSVYPRNYDLTSQLGHKILLIYVYDAAAPVSYKSYKLRSV